MTARIEFSTNNTQVALDKPSQDSTSAPLAQVVLSSVPSSAKSRPAQLHLPLTQHSEKIGAVAEKYAPFASSSEGSTEIKRECDPPPMPETVTLGPTSTNRDLEIWVQQQLALGPEEQVTHLSLENCPNITDPTILEPLVLSLLYLNLKGSGIRKVNPHSPLWWILDLKEYPRKSANRSHYEQRLLVRDDDGDEDIAIKFLNWEAALCILSGNTRVNTVDPRAYVVVYELPNKTPISHYPGMISIGCFYPPKLSSRLALLRQAEAEYLKSLPSIERSSK